MRGKREEERKRNLRSQAGLIDTSLDQVSGNGEVTMLRYWEHEWWQISFIYYVSKQHSVPATCLADNGER